MKSIKKLYISILSFIVTIIVFGTVSYAWISVATTYNIDGLSIQASSGNELQISIDGIHFANRLPAVEIEELFRDIRLYDVTSMDGVNFYTGGLRPIAPAHPGEHYLSFDLWLRTIRQEHSVYLINDVSNLMTFDDNMEGTYFISQGVVWTNRIGFFNGPTLDDFVQPNTTARYYATEAIRISVVELIDDMNSLDIRNPESLKRFIYDPSGNPYRGFGVGIGAYSYFTNQAGLFLTIPEDRPNTSYRLSQVDRFDPYQALDNESHVATLQETDEVDSLGRTYYRAKIRVNIWIEGWDADAFDAIHKDMVKIQLQFKALNPAV